MKNKKIPDMRLMEKSFLDIKKTIDSKQFNSIEEVQAFMNDLTGKQVPEFDGPETPFDRAQDLIYDAYEKNSIKDRLLLAYKALFIYPDCADAYNLLAEDEAKNDRERFEFYSKGEAAGRRQLGEDFIKGANGELWMHISARPYMRSMQGVVNVLWDMGERRAAIDKCREMLKLNTGDNQGMRYLLCSYLCAEKLFTEADTLMNTGKYKNDSGIEWAYNGLLVEFILRGDSEKARQLVHDALKRNIHAALFLSGTVKIPKRTPDMFSPQSEEEAVIYVHLNLESWLSSYEAYAWFMNTMANLMQKYGPDLLDEGKDKTKLTKKPRKN